MQGRGTEAGEKIAHGKFSRTGQGDLAHPCPSPLGYRPWWLPCQVPSVAQMLKVRPLLGRGVACPQPCLDSRQDPWFWLLLQLGFSLYSPSYSGDTATRAAMET